MLLATISLSLNYLLFLPIVPAHISAVEIMNCMLLSNCSKKEIIIGRRTDNSPDTPPARKTCKDRDKEYQEGEEIESDGGKLVCKDGRFVPRDE